MDWHGTFFISFSQILGSILVLYLKSIHIELIGPTMPTVADNIGVAFSGMGSVLAWRGGGYLVATIFGVVLPNIVKQHSEGLLACAYLLAAIGKI